MCIPVSHSTNQPEFPPRVLYTATLQVRDDIHTGPQRLQRRFPRPFQEPAPALFRLLMLHLANEVNQSKSESRDPRCFDEDFFEGPSVMCIRQVLEISG